MQSRIIADRLHFNPFYQSFETLQAIRRFETHPRRSAPKPPQSDIVQVPKINTISSNDYFTMGVNHLPPTLPRKAPIKKPPRRNSQLSITCGDCRALSISAPYSNLGRQVISPQYGTGSTGVHEPDSLPNSPSKPLFVDTQEDDENLYYNISDNGSFVSFTTFRGGVPVSEL